MAKPSLVCYDQNEDVKFFLCRQCRTAIALPQELIHKHPDKQHAFFRDLVNVDMGANYQIVTGQTGAIASCITCETNLGSKFISLMFETAAIKAGRFMIDLKKLLFWNGNEMVYADTEEPVQNA